MTSKKAFIRIKQHCESTCLGQGQSPYKRFFQSIIPCKEDLKVLQQSLNRLEKLENIIELITEILKIENKEDDIAELKMLYRLSKERLSYIYNAKYMKALREGKIKLTSKEIIKNKISELEDSLNRYSLSEKYKVKQSILKIDIANYEQVLKDLERLEKLEKENKKLKEIIKDNFEEDYEVEND